MSTATTEVKDNVKKDNELVKKLVDELNADETKGSSPNYRNIKQYLRQLEADSKLHRIKLKAEWDLHFKELEDKVKFDPLTFAWLPRTFSNYDGKCSKCDEWYCGLNCLKCDKQGYMFTQGITRKLGNHLFATDPRDVKIFAYWNCIHRGLEYKDYKDGNNIYDKYLHNGQEYSTMGVLLDVYPSQYTDKFEQSPGVYLFFGEENGQMAEIKIRHNDVDSDDPVVVEEFTFFKDQSQDNDKYWIKKRYINKLKNPKVDKLVKDIDTIDERIASRMRDIELLKKHRHNTLESLKEERNDDDPEAILIRRDLRFEFDIPHLDAVTQGICRSYLDHDWSCSQHGPFYGERCLHCAKKYGEKVGWSMYGKLIQYNPNFLNMNQEQDMKLATYWMSFIMGTEYKPLTSLPHINQGMDLKVALDKPFDKEAYGVEILYKNCHGHGSRLVMDPG